MSLSYQGHPRARWVVRGPLGAVVACALGALGGGFVSRAGAQETRLYETSELARGHNRAFSNHYPQASRLLNGIEYSRGALYEALWTTPGAPVSHIEATQYGRLADNVLRDPPRLRPQLAAVQLTYGRVAPRADAILGWARLFARQVYDVLADDSISPAEKDAYVLELLGYYRSRSDLALSSYPKSMALLDGSLYSLSFRQKYPKFNGLSWAITWLEQGVYEALLTAPNATMRQAQVDAVVKRFWQMLENAPETTPFLIPRIVAVAPAFSARYPEVGAILDNMQLLQNVLADILVSPEIPRGAKGREIDIVARRFRSDTSQSLSFREWLQLGQTLGLHNMGGPTVGFTAELPKPTVARGVSMAHVGGTAPTPVMGDMPGMDHANMAAQQDTGRAARLAAIQQRMFADPVIRERVATDPVLQRLLSDAGISVAAAATGLTQSMDHMNMPGMQHRNMNIAADSGVAMGPGGTNVSAADRRRAIEFIVRLLSDPAVEGRIHSDPELHRLWSDPDVQRRLAELRRASAPPNERDATLKPRPPRENQERRPQ